MSFPLGRLVATPGALEDFFGPALGDYVPEEARVYGIGEDRRAAGDPLEGVRSKPLELCCYGVWYKARHIGRASRRGDKKQTQQETCKPPEDYRAPIGSQWAAKDRSGP